MKKSFYYGEHSNKWPVLLMKLGTIIYSIFTLGVVVAEMLLLDGTIGSGILSTLISIYFCVAILKHMRTTQPLNFSYLLILIFELLTGFNLFSSVLTSPVFGLISILTGSPIYLTSIIILIVLVVQQKKGNSAPTLQIIFWSLNLISPALFMLLNGYYFTISTIAFIEDSVNLSAFVYYGCNFLSTVGLFLCELAILLYTVFTYRPKKIYYETNTDTTFSRDLNDYGYQPYQDNYKNDDYNDKN